MPKILSDERDPTKKALGEQLQELRKNDPQKLGQLLSQLTDKEAEEILYDDEIWCRDNQWIPLNSKNPIHFMSLGRGSGKTYTGAITIKRGVEKHGLKNILIIAATSRDIRSTVVPAIVERYPDSHPNKPYFSPAKSQLIWPNGALAVCLSAESGPESPRGGNFSFTWMDEAAFYAQNEGIIDQAMLATREEPSLLLITTTPKATPKMIELYEKGQDPDNTMVKMYRGSTYENAANLSDLYMTQVVEMYENSSLAKAELYGELILVNEGALFQMETIQRNTVDVGQMPRLGDICIGVDPAVLAKKSSAKGRTPDATGIVVSGLGEDDLLYTLEGHTGSYSMVAWVRRVCQLFDKYSEMHRVYIAIEINKLGEESVRLAFKDAGRDDVARYIKPFYATQSKLQRASPYALMAEQDKIKFVRGPYLHSLEVELTTFDGTGKSPNSYDAVVWSWNKLKPPRKRVTKSYELLI